MASPRLCVDIDNVIAQTDKAMRKVIREYSGGAVDLKYPDVVQFNYWECHDKAGRCISREDWHVVHSLFSQRAVLLSIKPMPHVQAHLSRLAKHFDIHLATSRLSASRSATVEWLEACCFPAHDLHFLKHGEKHSSLGRFTAAVEDDREQAAAFAEGGTRAFLLAHPWNLIDDLHLPDLERVEDWASLTERILQLVP